MSDWSDIAHLQQLALRLSAEDAELINRLERRRLKLEFMLAGIHRPTRYERSNQEQHEGRPFG